MTTRWAATILCNSLLEVCVWRHLPVQARFMRVTQTAVMLFTAWNIVTRPLLPAAMYDPIWTQLDLAQAAIEIIVLGYILHDTIRSRFKYAPDVLTIILLGYHLAFWVAEYQAWLPKADGLCWMLYDFRKRINVLAILSLCLSMYYRSERNQRSWSEAWKTSTRSILRTFRWKNIRTTTSTRTSPMTAA